MIYYFFISCPENAENLNESPEVKQIQRLLKQFFDEYKKPAYPRKHEVISSYMNILGIKTDTTGIPPEGDEPYSRENARLFQRFITLLENEVTDSHKVIDYSGKLGITSRKLSAICRHFQGKSPKKIINEYLIIEAKRLLTGTSNPVKEISMHLGFSDQYQFSKYFKNQEGVSPADYRKRERSN